jgi:hypothetical protein
MAYSLLLISNSLSPGRGHILEMRLLCIFKEEKKMRTLKKTGVFTIMMVMLLCGAYAWAEEEGPSGEADVAFLSQYVWRGYALSDSSLVIQPSISAGCKGFGLNLWGNLDTDYDDTGKDFNETDLTFSYDKRFGKVGLGLGYIYYGLEGEDTQEFYASVSLDTILAPTLTVYRDYDLFDSWYVLLGVSHSFGLTEKVSLDLGGSVSYYSYDDRDYSELHDALISASIAIPIGKNCSLTPSLAYTFPLSSKAKAELKDMDGDDSHLVCGITLSIAF